MVANVEGKSQFDTFLGLLMESFIGVYELDCYGYISPTNYKIVILKNESKTNSKGTKPAKANLEGLFHKVATMHTQMILNPFFELSLAQSSSQFVVGSKQTLFEEESEESNSDCSSCSSSRGSFEESKKAPGKFSAKANNKECLKQLRQRIDKKVAEVDRKMRENF